jgi:hypothetical protein
MVRVLRKCSQLKLILIHQESRCTEKLNIVKFRAPFGEAGLHKKGQTVENCLQNVQHWSSHNNCSKCGKECSGRNGSGNLKQHETRLKYVYLVITRE